MLTLFKFFSSLIKVSLILFSPNSRYFEISSLCLIIAGFRFISIVLLLISALILANYKLFSKTIQAFLSFVKNEARYSLSA